VCVKWGLDRSGGRREEERVTREEGGGSHLTGGTPPNIFSGPDEVPGGILLFPRYP
jgi:hypothetical protein